MIDPDREPGGGPVARPIGTGPWWLALAWLLTAAGVQAAEPQDLIGAIGRAPAVVVAEVVAVTPLAHGGYWATLDVERSLLAGSKPPDRMTVAWEEPVPSLPPRLVAGRRILAAADPLPTASIWRLRVPDADTRAGLLGLAGDGDGYLIRPGAAELDVLEHYLALDPAAREGDAGVLQLARMAVVGQPRLADDAATHLAQLPALSNHLTPPAAAAIVEALLRSDVPVARERLLGMIEALRPAALRAPLEARIRAAGDAVPPVLYAALGALNDGLDEAISLELLASRSPEARAAAARHATGPESLDWLRDLARSDPDPGVRAAAVTRLVVLGGRGALYEATRALEDPVAEVRLAAVRAAATLDPDAVSSLRQIALGGQSDAARAALAALSLMGDEAHLALAELSVEHPDEAMRTLAGIAVGQPIGERH